MNCHEAERLSTPTSTTSSAPRESAAVQEHVASCVTCTQRLADRESLGPSDSARTRITSARALREARAPRRHAAA